MSFVTTRVDTVVILVHPNLLVVFISKRWWLTKKQDCQLNRDMWGRDCDFFLQRYYCSYMLFNIQFRRLCGSCETCQELTVGVLARYKELNLYRAVPM